MVAEDGTIHRFTMLALPSMVTGNICVEAENGGWRRHLFKPARDHVSSLRLDQLAVTIGDESRLPARGSARWKRFQQRTSGTSSKASRNIWVFPEHDLTQRGVDIKGGGPLASISRQLLAVIHAIGPQD